MEQNHAGEIKTTKFAKKNKYQSKVMQVIPTEVLHYI